MAVRREALDRLHEAQEDLEVARDLLKLGRCSHACFLAQQTAEKALKSLALVKLRERHRRAIEVFLSNVRGSFRDAEVYLTGSLARGDWLLDSDVDLVVVTDELSGRPPWERYALLRSLAPDDVPFDILAYTKAGFEHLMAFRRAIKNPDPLVRLL